MSLRGDVYDSGGQTLFQARKQQMCKQKPQSLGTDTVS